MPILEHFEQVASFAVGHGCDREVIDDEYVHAGDTCEQSRVGAVGACEAQLIEEARGAPVHGAMTFATRLLREGA